MNKIVVKKRVVLGVVMIGRVLLCGVANAAMVVTQTDKVQVAVYGQINKAELYAHAENEEEVYHVDNDNRSTRIGVKATAKPINKFTVGAHLEYEYESNANNKVGQEWSDTDDDDFADRTMEVFIECRFGKLSLGQGQGKFAFDDTTEVDLSGTAVVGAAKTQSMAGEVPFFDDGSPPLSTATVSAAFNHLNGFSRKNRIRYDSPSCNGFSLAVSSASGSKENQVSGCVSFLADNGLNLTMASGMLEDKSSSREDANYYYGKIGYIAQLFDLGSTAFAIDYGRFEEIKENDDKGDTIGVLAIQKLKNWNTEVYFGYRHYELDRTGTDFDNINAFMSGLRIKF
jgi:hypothetical protein